ncbi:MAG: TonB-dependent receptor [Taibaiella sp.]|nr:TonB-dependent receptor [Taibaiella sp.]
MRLLIGILMFVAGMPAVVLAQSAGLITGIVKDKKTQQSVIGAIVTVEGTTLGAATDTNGSFRIADVPSNSYNVKVQALGYENYIIYNLVVSSGNAQIVNVELDNDAGVSLKEVVVRRNPFSKNAETPLSLQTLSGQEIKSNPGGNFDVSRVIQAFPGVGGTAGSVGGFRNDLIIRGGAPNENVYYLDGIEVPVINHFATQGSAGGPTGIINTTFIEDVNLYTSAFPAKYDNPLSGVLQLKQRRANPEHVQQNIRLSATELAYSADGPLVKDRLTFLASARRSYLQLLFGVLQLPIRPSYWDFQYKLDYKINKKLSLYTLAVGAIDKFTFGTPKDLSAENVYILQSNPLIDQWSYTNGYGLKGLMNKGYWNLTFSRNMLNNQLNKYTDNQNPSPATSTLKIRSTEAENKFRFDMNKSYDKWSYSLGAMTQYDRFTNDIYSLIRTEVRDSNNNVVQPAVTIAGNTDIGFWKYGLHGQIAGKLLNNRLNLSLGIRTDGNTFTDDGNNLLRTLSPRLAASYNLSENLKLNASAGRYFKIPTYTILGFKDNSGNFVNRNARYTQCDHLVAGLEFMPGWQGARFTLEGFYKLYNYYPVSVTDSISLANKGGDFGVLGNEAIMATGNGKSYGVEFQFQQKLTKNFFTILSVTIYNSEFTNANGAYVPASWDNGQLISFIGGYKFKRNWELGVKFRYQGGAPYTPYDMQASQNNYLALGTGLLDYSQFNTLRLQAFHAMDVRIDKKWNFKKWSFDLYLDLANAYASAQPATPNFTFKRTADNTGFATTDGNTLKADGSNGIPLLLNDNSGRVIPTLGFIIEL